MDNVKQYNHLHKIGDIVKVYDDPITKLNLEGTAKIASLEPLDHYYKVVFDNDNWYRGAQYQRFIY